MILYNIIYKNYFSLIIYFIIFLPIFKKSIIYLKNLIILNYKKNYFKNNIFHKISFKDLLEIESDISYECNICLEEFKLTEQITLLSCGCLQIYHENCLSNWFERNPTCPTCRKNFLN